MRKARLSVQETTLKAGWETALFAIPFIGMLLFGFFHLDEVFVAPREKTGNPRAACGKDQDGKDILTDPDGRPWTKPRLGK
jgi:hypothetical protein